MSLGLFLRDGEPALAYRIAAQFPGGELWLFFVTLATPEVERCVPLEWVVREQKRRAGVNT